jgi:hypothetical protein
MARRNGIMAPATPAAISQDRWRRRGGALLLAMMLTSAAGAAWAADGKDAPVYIWRDANGTVRFTSPPPR